MKYRPYQARFIEENPKKTILAWEMRVGKTLPAAVWVNHPSRSGNAFIVTPKQNKQDWIGMKTKAKVLSKEEFKKEKIVKPTAMVIDEGHYFASALFLRKGNGRSQLSEKLYEIVRENPEMDILILTATPVRQDAWSLHTLLCYIGVYYPWKEWRERFFVLEEQYFLPRPAWMKVGDVPKAWVPRHDWRIKIREVLEKHCNIISMKDIVQYLPPMDPIFIHIKQPKYKAPEGKIVTWIDEHRHEQVGKAKEILKLGYRKVIVVAHYTEQIDQLEKELGKDRLVFVLDGRTKDAHATKHAAQEADDCYFIVQDSMGFGFDGYMFGAIVFASMSHSCLNHTQMLGRMRHVDYLKKVTRYYLIGGRWDQRIYDTIEQGRDFNPHEYDAS